MAKGGELSQPVGFGPQRPSEEPEGCCGGFGLKMSAANKTEHKRLQPKACSPVWFPNLKALKTQHCALLLNAFLSEGGPVLCN